jgi:hypothetical protein
VALGLQDGLHHQYLQFYPDYNFPEKKKKELSDLIPNASPEAIDLLESMFHYSSRKRPSTSEYFSFNKGFSSMNTSPTSI